LQAQTVATIGGSPEDFQRHVDAENRRWTAVVTGAGLRK
jgi:hypothetical protein